MFTVLRTLKEQQRPEAVGPFQEDSLRETQRKLAILSAAQSTSQRQHRHRGISIQLCSVAIHCSGVFLWTSDHRHETGLPSGRTPGPQTPRSRWQGDKDKPAPHPVSALGSNSKAFLGALPGPFPVCLVLSLYWPRARRPKFKSPTCNKTVCS